LPPLCATYVIQGSYSNCPFPLHAYHALFYHTHNVPTLTPSLYTSRFPSTCRSVDDSLSSRSVCLLLLSRFTCSGFDIRWEHSCRFSPGGTSQILWHTRNCSLLATNSLLFVIFFPLLSPGGMEFWERQSITTCTSLSLAFLESNLLTCMCSHWSNASEKRTLALVSSFVRPSSSHQLPMRSPARSHRKQISKAQGVQPLKLFTTLEYLVPNISNGLVLVLPLGWGRFRLYHSAHGMRMANECQEVGVYWGHVVLTRSIAVSLRLGRRAAPEVDERHPTRKITLTSNIAEASHGVMQRIGSAAAIPVGLIDEMFVKSLCNDGCVMVLNRPHRLLPQRSHNRPSVPLRQGGLLPRVACYRQTILS
jgi:hypothetical protein